MMCRFIGILSFFLYITFSVTAQKNDFSDRPDSTFEAIELWADTNKLYVRNGEAGMKIVIYSVVGTKVYEVELKNSNSEIPIQLPKGYYILKIGEIARKIAVK